MSYLGVGIVASRVRGWRRVGLGEGGGGGGYNVMCKVAINS